jgi:VWFA-related protein
MKWSSIVIAAVCAYAVGVRGQSAQQNQSAAPAQPSFRSGVTAVPVEVRVVDTDGKPIQGLKKEDFTVIEDGVLQSISHFSPATLVAEAPRAGLKAKPDTPAFTTLPQNYRVFLIILGMRALGDVARHPETLNALLDFVRHKLLPQDQVALLAGARAVDFTADHEKVARQLESLRVAPQGGAAVAPALPPPPAIAPDAGSLFANVPTFDPAPTVENELGFADYVKARKGQPLSELESLFYGVSYLRFMEGEKHLIFLTETGPHPTWAQANALTTAANNARVAINTIQSERRIGDTMTSPNQAFSVPPGGEKDPRPWDYGYNANAPELRPPPKPYQGLGTPEATQTPLGPGESTAPPATAAELGFGGIYDLRDVALQTGGTSSMWTDAGPALGRVDDATRANYLLAYYPTNAEWNGRNRSVVVKVNRPDARLLYRHGYSASSDIQAFDRRRVVTNARLEAAGSQVIDIHDLEVTIVPSFVKLTAGGAGEVTAALSIDATRLAWGRGEDGRHTVRIEIALYCADGDQKIIGQTRRSVSLALTDDTYARVMKEGIARTITLATTKAPRYVKAIVFDYAADKLGSKMVKIK